MAACQVEADRFYQGYNAADPDDPRGQYPRQAFRRYLLASVSRVMRRLVDVQHRMRELQTFVVTARYS